MKNIFKKIALVLSIGFNVIYFLFCSIISLLLIDIHNIPFNISLVILTILILPILFTIFSIKTKNIDKILKFFFAIEAPTLLLALSRLFLLKELTPFYLFLLFGIIICILIYAFELIYDNKIKEKYKTLSLLAFEIPVILGGYFSLLALFVLCPLIVIMLKSISLDSFYSFVADILSFDFATFIELFYLLVFILFFVGVVALFFATPITSIVIYIREFIKRYKENKKLKPCIIWAATYLLIFYISSFHFSNISTALDIQAVKNISNYSEACKVAKKILPKQFIIKNSIKDNYLASVRYIFDENNDYIYSLYKEAFEKERLANFAQNIFNKIAYPFTYQNDFETRNATEQYKLFFDEDIQQAQQKAISKSIRSTFFIKQEAASLLDVNSKDVKVLSRDVEIYSTNYPETYRVKIRESYKNRTQRDKEVYYRFSLPKYSSIVELKLGDKLQYKGVIAPKGAARKTYENQIARNSDPALIEQNGLRQYALRVYPIDVYRNKTDIQKVEFEYYTKLVNGKIYLPNIFEKRNAYFSLGSKFSAKLDNEKLNISKDTKYIKIKEIEPQKPNYDTNKKIALLLDTSYSNKINWRKYINKNFAEIKDFKNIDYYFFNLFLSEKMTSLDNVEQINFLKTARLDAYCALKEKYDRVIMLSDTSVYDYSKNETCQNMGQLYVVHVDKKGTNSIPPYDINFTNLIYKTNGDIFTSLKEAFNSETVDINANLQPQIKANMEVDKILRNENSNDNNTKEKIYEIAKKNSIVTPYSSLITLVNEFQKKELKENEKADDKFYAQLETGEDENLKDENISTVPEPEDYIYLILIFIMLSVFLFKKSKWKY